jgi:hypothetical protein
MNAAARELGRLRKLGLCVSPRSRLRAARRTPSVSKCGISAALIGRREASRARCLERRTTADSEGRQWLERHDNDDWKAWPTTRARLRRRVRRVAEVRNPSPPNPPSRRSLYDLSEDEPVAIAEERLAALYEAEWVNLRSGKVVA